MPATNDQPIVSSSFKENFCICRLRARRASAKCTFIKHGKVKVKLFHWITNFDNPNAYSQFARCSALPRHCLANYSPNVTLNWTNIYFVLFYAWNVSKVLVATFLCANLSFYGASEEEYINQLKHWMNRATRCHFIFNFLLKSIGPRCYYCVRICVNIDERTSIGSKINWTWIKRAE